jgi:hypothetical protein
VPLKVMQEQDQDDPFTGLEPNDGFKIIHNELGNDLSLHIGVNYRGELSNLHDRDPEDATVEIAEWKDPSPAEAAECTRLQLVLEGVARYLSTGGNWNELNAALERMRMIATGGIQYAGYHLLDSYLNTEGDFEHIFVQTGTNNAVLWVEGQFLERKTLEQIRREQEEEEEGEISGCGAVDADLDLSERPGEGDQGQLLPPPDPESA